MASLRDTLKVIVRPLQRIRPVKTSYDGPKMTLAEFEARSKASRQRFPRGSISGIQVRNGIWYPMIRPEVQVLITDIVWIVGAVVDRVCEESVKGGYRFDPKYGAKCVVCGAEYDTEPEICDTEGCFSTQFDHADPRLLDPIKKLFARPNWDDETERIVKPIEGLLKDAVYYMETIDDWHWEAIFDQGGNLSQVWPMNSEFLRQFADPSLTVGKYFCPSCLEAQGANKSTYDAQLEACPKCDHPLEISSWCQIDESEHVTMVWSKKEILHGQARAHGRRVAGRSKVLRCWAMAQIIRWQELYQWAAYSGNKAPDAVVTIEGMSQAEVNEMVDEIEKFKQDHPEYKDVIWMGLGAGDKGGHDVSVQHILGNLADMDAVQLAMHYTKAIAMNFGVSPEMIGIQEAGKLGHPEEVLQVAYDTIQEVDTNIETFVNSQVMPFFPDAEKQWLFKMNPPAPEDKKKVADEAAAWIDVILKLKSAGARAKLDPAFEKDWPIEIESWPSPEEEPAGPHAEVPVTPEGELDMTTPIPPIQQHAIGLATPGVANATYRGRRIRRKGDDRFAVHLDTWDGSRLVLDKNPGIDGAPATRPLDPKDIEDKPVVVAPDGELIDGYHRVGGILARLTGEMDRVWRKWPDGVHAKVPVAVVQDPEFREQVAHQFHQQRNASLGEALQRARDAMEGGSKVFEMGLKALTPRNLPRDDAPSGIRAFENQLMKRISRMFDKAVRDIERARGRPTTQQEAHAAMERILRGLRETIATQGAKAVLEAYTIGLDATKDEFPMAGFTDLDRGIVAYLEANPNELSGLLSKVIDDVRGVLNEEIRASFVRGIDIPTAVRNAADRLATEKWKAERVVRTETTRIVNRARVAQYEKYAPPESEYDWIPSKDQRVEPECLKLEAGNPWPLDRLREASRNFIPHPNCRCTVVRHVGLP